MKAYVVDSAAVRSNLQQLQTRAGSAVFRSSERFFINIITDVAFAGASAQLRQFQNPFGGTFFRNSCASGKARRFPAISRLCLLVHAGICARRIPQEELLQHADFLQIGFQLSG